MVLPAFLALSFFLTFCIFFSDLIFYKNWYQKVSKWEPQNITKSHKSRKTYPQNAPTVKTCKKTLSGRGRTSKIYDRYTLSTAFSQAQGSQKRLTIGAKMEPPGTPNHKNPEKKTSEKTSKKQHCKKCVTTSKCTQNWTTFSLPDRSQNHTNPQNPQNGPPGLQSEPPSLQNDQKS